MIEEADGKIWRGKEKWVMEENIENRAGGEEVKEAGMRINKKRCEEIKE